ncbi:hypothetical protein AJ80_03004 [Polytolypa hystricis UAMH7299]|uniref:Uncharacterized protein n=1 Tax=Polytolypa hystricis (strain UAMH7299) TaxID=1447883 RepID=A0A2B7YNS8_POLH7|nr:hypothetical protein AJ80_03004 [Polytolypa hystricis UAMH7299]
MFRRRVPLGSTSYTYDRHSIRLTATNSAQVSLSDVATQGPGPLTGSEGFELGGSWIVSGCKTTFNIGIQVHDIDHFKSTAPLQLLGDISNVLENAKLWSDLGLVVFRKSREASIDQTSIGRIRLGLELQQDVNDSCRLQSRKFPRSIVTATPNVQPPAPIAKWLLHEVDIYLDLGPRLPQQPTITSFPLAQQGTSISEDFEALDELSDTLLELSAGSDIRSLLVYKSFPDVKASISPGDEAWESLDSDSPFSSQSSLSSVPSRSPDLTKSENYDILKTAQYRPYLNLLDTAFRRLFSNCLSRALPGISTSHVSHPTALAELSPCLFSPGYKLDISQRACFIPMIAKGMASLLNNSLSPLTASKFDQLKRTYEQRYQAGEENAIPEDTRAMLKCFLWTTMQQGLFNPEAARKLSPLTAGHTSSHPETEESNTAPFSSLFDEVLFAKDELYGMTPSVLDEWCFSDEDEDLLVDATEDIDFTYSINANPSEHPNNPYMRENYGKRDTTISDVYSDASSTILAYDDDLELTHTTETPLPLPLRWPDPMKPQLLEPDMLAAAHPPSSDIELLDRSSSPLLPLDDDLGKNNTLGLNPNEHYPSSPGRQVNATTTTPHLVEDFSDTEDIEMLLE